MWFFITGTLLFGKQFSRPNEALCFSGQESLSLNRSNCVIFRSLASRKFKEAFRLYSFF